ncbi:acyltransferase family protein [Bradyrhizobium sp. 2S1]|uniref:acyltransferase family protein n=1 Tax=Bradyrhizobium sp. 2S1 TaxID=1404429 RepID=UPI00140BC3B2|nr:acyltransferase family protein [Bradyrhizobium sp. 2S1]MCK7674049.1 acyltransferase [Bradyrhizobium sp. 2S1]
MFPNATTYRADIDGLRAFAVVSVVLYHAFPPAAPGGFVGVDVFFVISGFLISSILVDDLNEHRFSFVGFYSRRARRIFPALTVCLAASLAYGFVALTPSELAQLGKHVFFGAGFLSNIALWSEAGYFDTAASYKPLLHLWSLGIEEQFYILWPVLLWGAFRLKANLRWLLVVLLIVSFGVNVALSIADLSNDFYLPISRFWELLVGGALALFGRRVAAGAQLRSAASIAGAGALLSSVALFTPELRYPGWFALLPVAGAAAMIFAGPDAPINRAVLSSRACVAVGLISYPLYIWHWPLISYAYVIRLGKPPTPLLALALVSASFLLAWITYRFVELPVRFGAMRRRNTVLVCACLATVGIFGAIVWAGGGFPERFPRLPGVDIQKVGAARLDADFKPTADMEVSEHDWTLVARLGARERKIALSGDSLLFHYGPRAQQLLEDSRLAVSAFFVTGPRCPPVPGVVQEDKFSACSDLTAKLLEVVRREKVRSVVLGAAWSGYSAEGMSIKRDGTRLSLTTGEGQDAFYASLEEFVRELQSEGAAIYLVLGLPTHEAFAPRNMVARGITGFRIAPNVDATIRVSDLKGVLARSDARLRAIGSRTGAALLDPFPDICGAGAACSPFFGAGEPKYSDQSHLRPAFVRENLHFLDRLLE